MRIDQVLAQQAEARPDKTAIRDADGIQWSFRALDEACSVVASELRRRGVKPHDRVMVVSENAAACAIGIFAAIRVGAWAVPVNARMTAAELDRLMDHAEPAAILFTSDVSVDAAHHAQRLGAESIGCGLSGLTCKAGPNGFEQDVAVLLYTTGTTGTPKGVMLTHANLAFGGAASAELREMTQADVVYGALPMSHVFGLTSMLVAAMQTGACIVMEPRFSPELMYRALCNGVTLLPAVPQMHAKLMHYVQQQGVARLDSPTLRYVSSGAAPLDPAWKRKAEAFYGIALQNGYGMTEASAGVCASRNPIGTQDVSVGPPLPGVEVKIDLQATGGGNGVGEVLVRGPNVMLGYFNNPDATRDVLIDDGWMRSGDLGQMDADGKLMILGRSKELIIRGGFNVYPPDVEAALNDHPMVVQSAVVGQATEEADETVVAFVQVADKNAVTPEELRAFASRQLAPYKRPQKIVFVDALPAASTGKVLKHKLLAHFADQLQNS